MNKAIRYQVSVGVFVVAAAVILGYISLTLSRTRVRDGIDVAFLFSDACGLVKDAPVSVAGVEIGYVKELELDSKGALVTARIRASTGLRRNVRATVRSKSLLGEKYLALTPGGPGAPPLRDGDLITATETPVQIDQIIAMLGSALEAVDPGDVAKLVRALAEDPEAARRIVRNMDVLLGRLSGLDEKQVREFADGIRIRARLF